MLGILDPIKIAFGVLCLLMIEIYFEIYTFQEDGKIASGV